MTTSGEPLYLQIARALRSEISDHFNPGDQIDSEGRLAERFNVNRHTLRRAIDELVREGLLERRRGVGLFVLDSVFEYPLHSETRLTANLEHMGVQGNRRFIRKYLAIAPAAALEHLLLPAGARVTCLESIIEVTKRSFSLATHYIVHDGLEKVYEEFEDGSLHGFIRENYGLSLKRVRSTIHAGLPTQGDATLLRIPTSLPIITVRSLNHEVESGQPIEFVESRFRSDRIELSVKF
jgi:GntR family phosphonate transport system transcriptional regulator